MDITEQAKEARPGNWKSMGNNGARLNLRAKQLLLLVLPNGSFRAVIHERGLKRLTTVGEAATVADAVSFLIS